MSQATVKGIEINIDYDQYVPHMILADSRALRQIIINLMSNAIKFTDKGSITIKVACLEVSVDIAKLVISVIDTGIGIPEAKLNVIFDHFQQVDPSYRRRYGGTGLGLSIAKRLIDMMDGTLKVVSKEGEGSTFLCCIDFPLQDKSIIEHPWLIHQASVPILIVDDTPRGEITRKQLGSSHCQVISSDAAINFFIAEEKNSFSQGIVIIDDRISFFDPYDLAQQITNISRPNQPMLILLTSVFSMLTKKKSEKFGFFECIVKPIQPLELQNCLVATWESWVEIHNLKNERKSKKNDFDSKSYIKKKKRVLLIDDEEKIQFIHSEFLKELNCEVDKAGDGKEALHILIQNPKYDLIFVDMGLPGMSGPDLVRTYRQKEKFLNIHTPIIAITGYSSQKDKDAFIDSGVDEVLIKPVTIEQLEKVIQNYAETSKYSSLIIQSEVVDPVLGGDHR